MGYSVSSTSTYRPSLRRSVGNDPGRPVSGRGHTDRRGGSADERRFPLGRLQLAELDPPDDCTFFYTQEYYQVTDRSPGTSPFGVNWQTRVGSFNSQNARRRAGDADR